MDVLYGYDAKNGLYSLYRTRLPFLFTVYASSSFTKQEKSVLAVLDHLLANSEASWLRENMTQQDVKCIG